MSEEGTYPPVMQKSWCSDDLFIMFPEETGTAEAGIFFSCNTKTPPEGNKDFILLNLNNLCHPLRKRELVNHPF